jgi:putative transcriptional regulator
MTDTTSQGSRVGADLVEAFEEMAAYLRGEVEAESYEIDFERQFRISARTMEAYEQGRRRPDTAMQTLLRVIEREPDAVRRALNPAPTGLGTRADA